MRRIRALRLHCALLAAAALAPLVLVLGHPPSWVSDTIVVACGFVLAGGSAVPLLRGRIDPLAGDVAWWEDALWATFGLASAASAWTLIDDAFRLASRSLWSRAGSVLLALLVLVAAGHVLRASWRDTRPGLRKVLAWGLAVSAVALGPSWLTFPLLPLMLATPQLAVLYLAAFRWCGERRVWGAIIAAWTLVGSGTLLLALAGATRGPSGLAARGELLVPAAMVALVALVLLPPAWATTGR